jgi:hypothetical protein
MHPQYVYAFEEGDGKNTQLLGGKGANLCEMTQIGVVSTMARKPPLSVAMAFFGSVC